MNYSCPSNAEETQRLSGTFAATVVFTGQEPTHAALEEAAALSLDLQLQIQVVIPCVVPYPLPIHRPRVEPAFRYRKCISMCQQTSANVAVHLVLCRDTKRCLKDYLPPRSMVFIGEPTQFWKCLALRGLAREIRAWGHEVQLIAH